MTIRTSTPRRRLLAFLAASLLALSASGCANVARIERSPCACDFQPVQPDGTVPRRA